MDSTQLVVNLLDGKRWSGGEGGNLRVIAANTLGTQEGYVYFPNGGVVVAHIVKDSGSETTGDVSIIPSVQPVYSSSIHEKIVVTGTGFKPTLKLTMSNPKVVQGSSFTLSFVSETQVDLILTSNGNWGETGPLLVTSISPDGSKSFQVGGSEDHQGIRIATIFSNPTITSSENHIFESHSKAVLIKGSGFTNLDSTSIKLSPTYDESYHIVSVAENAILIRLEPEKDWLPGSFTINEDSKIPLYLVSINTGAGEIDLEGDGTQIGLILKDKEHHICDDSCEFAFDGMCDDGSAPVFSYYGYYFYDDDYGGFEHYFMRYLLIIFLLWIKNIGGYFDDTYSWGAYGDDYYLNDQSEVAPACLQGTDCTDCGGVQTDDPNVMGVDDDNPVLSPLYLF